MTDQVTPEVTLEVTPDVDAVNMIQERVDETAKCKREWVGLTEANKSTAIKLIEAGMFNLAFKYLEEQLKEKNSGTS
jgi:hypothetical protein